MNRQNQHELIVSGIHLELTPSLKTFVQEKTERLFRHEERIVRIRVELECDPKETVSARFKAKGHIPARIRPADPGFFLFSPSKERDSGRRAPPKP